MMTRNNCAAWLLERDNFCILTHVRPDGDTMGSASALCVGLRQMGKTAHLLYNDGASPFLDKCQVGLTKQWPDEGDTLVTVDVASPNMLPEAWRVLQDRIGLRIDHHGSATSFTPEELVDAGAAACAELVYDILMAMGAEMTKELAWRLYIAISTDTGCFRYHNTQSHTFEVAAACAEVSKDLPELNRILFDTNSLKRLRLQGWIVEHLQFLCQGQIAICALPLSLEKEMGLTEDDMENISGFPRSIEGVKMAATLRQQEDGVIKLSVRALPGYDASAVCAGFGGGGHRGAAGASLDMTMEQAVEAVIAAMPTL